MCAHRLEQLAVRGGFSVTPTSEQASMYRVFVSRAGWKRPTLFCLGGRKRTMVRRGASCAPPSASPFEKFLYVGAGKTTTTKQRAQCSAGAGAGDEAGERKKRKTDALDKAPTVSGVDGGLKPKLGSKPLRLILVGHNPSAHAWRSGHYYSNPSNRMWKILRETGINTSSRTGADADDVLAEEAGVGFIDVGVGHPGTDSSKFTSEDFSSWSKGFYYYLGRHLEEANESIGCRCGNHCGAPKVVAFTGKRQFVELLNTNCKALGLKKVSTVDLGPQDPRTLPQNWPFPREGPTKTQVWVLTSTSGASALTNEARIKPYQELSDVLSEIPWPITSECCKGKT